MDGKDGANRRRQAGAEERSVERDFGHGANLQPQAMIREPRNQRQESTNVISTTSSSAQGHGQAPPAPMFPTPENDVAKKRAPDPLAQVATRAASGDAIAIRQLFTSIAPPLLRVIRGILGPNHADVEDVLQDALLRVLKGLTTFRGEGTVLHFAARIATRATVDRIRRDRPRPLDMAESEPVPSPREEVVAARKRELLSTLLAALPPEQADALVLRAVLGHSNEEIAELFKVPVNTVRSRLRLAKENLRRIMDRDPRMAELDDDNEDG